MRRIEFKKFLETYKEVKEIIEPIALKKMSGWDFLNFHIAGGRILATMWSGEDAYDIPDAIQEVDVTKEVISELIPDALIF